jgi:signal transduction histidine kinase
MCLPYSIEKMHETINNLNVSNEKLAKTRQALQQSEKLASMGQLSAGIAHELNNPLGVISMYSNILKDESKEDDPIREDLDLIVEQAERCKHIVGGLLNFARKNQVRLEDVELINFCQRSLQSVVIPENIKVKVDTNLKSLMVSMDRGQMMQLMTNLEKNAIDAMPEGGTLTLSISNNGNEYMIKVSDTGCGIAQENMDKIFTPFFTTKSIGKGTGMGLPLVYGIVKMHKGQIDIESNNYAAKGPTGTSFILRFPKSPITLTTNS